MRIKNIILISLLTISYSSTVFSYAIFNPPIRWAVDSSPVFFVDVRLPQRDTNAAFESAIAAWNAQGFSLLVNRSFEDPCNWGNGRNGVAFRITACGVEWGSVSALAFAKRSFADGGNGTNGAHISEVDIVFNPNFFWDVYNGNLRIREGGSALNSSDYIYDLRRIAIHEIGHGLGFHHEDNLPSIMGTSSGDIYELQPTDIEGVRALYPELAQNNGPAERDFNGDGKSDILWRHFGNGANAIYQMDGTNIQSAAIINQVDVSQWIIAGTGDFNGDGKSDILWRNINNGINVIYQMDGTTIQSAVVMNQVDDLNWVAIGISDFNGDGKSDILWRNAGSGVNLIYLMDGTTVQSVAVINQVNDFNWQIADTGDFNGDGKSDILWRHIGNGANLIYLMDGATIQSAVIINQVADLNWHIEGTGDFNGDGKSDILWRNFSSGLNVIYLMNGTTIQSAAVVNQVADSNWGDPGIGDFNGDGKSDILWRNFSSGLNVIYLMNGTTIQSAAVVNQVADLFWAPIAH